MSVIFTERNVGYLLEGCNAGAKARDSVVLPRKCTQAQAQSSDYP